MLSKLSTHSHWNNLIVNEGMAGLRGEAIIPEVCLYATICYLAGGSYSNIFYLLGISLLPPSFYHVVLKTIKAINACEELATKFPSTVEECNKSSKAFEKVSFHGTIDNCVRVVDGFLLKIRTQSKKEAKNIQ